MYTSDENFNVLDNEYFRLVLYEMSDGGTVREKPNYKLHYCEESQLDFVLKENRKFYPKAVCVKQDNSTVLRGNWFTKNHSLLAVSLVKCQPDPTKNK